VQVGTASFIQPTAMLDILQGIKEYMMIHRITDIKELIGKVEVDLTA
jgi:dihydroorotate dehydrogenase (NAD+) catalytic subunit